MYETTPHDRMKPHDYARGPKMAAKLQEDTVTRQKEETAKPPMYKVVLLNDDFTPFEFVIFLMVEVFKKTEEEAIFVTQEIHHKGKGICGVYPKDIAETKQSMAMALAEREEHPLQCLIEADAPGPKKGMGL